MPKKRKYKMRIITGTARGARLFSPEGETTRPTTEMAKEGIFSSIQFDLVNTDVLDLFAGSGQLGLEALSRGAKSAVLTDSDADAFEIIKKNAQKTGLYQKCRVLRMEYGEYIKAASRAGDKFDFIFIDPPYESRIAEEAAKRCIKSGLVKHGGKIFCESDRPEFDSASFGEEAASFVEETKIYKYGKTYFHVLRLK